MKTPPQNLVIKILQQRMLDDENIRFALLFGSHASGRAKPQSDLDLALHFRNPPEGLDLLNLISTFSDLARKEVDLVVLNAASPFLRHQVVKHGIRLFIKDPVLFREFREKTMIDYDTYCYLSGLNRYD